MFRKLSKADIRFLLLVLAAHTVFFFIALHCKRIYNGDSYEYIYAAINLKHYGWFYAGNPALPVRSEYMTLRPPGYPLFLYLVYLLSVNNWMVLVLQNLVSIFNVYFIRHIARSIGYSRRYDWVLMAFVLFYPSQFINANIIAPDILLQTAVLFYFYFFLKLVRQKRWRFALAMSICLAAGMMIKPVLYPAVYIHATAIIVLAIRRHTSLFRTTFCALLPLIVAMLYGYVNYMRTGKLHFSSSQSFNSIFYYYNYYRDAYGTTSAEKFLSDERSKIEKIPDFATRYDYANDRGKHLLKQNFIPYTRYHMLRSLEMLIDPGKGELDMFTGLLTLGRLYDVYHKTGFYDTYRQRGVEGLEDYFGHNPTIPIALIIVLFNIARLIGFLFFLFSKKTKLAHSFVYIGVDRVFCSHCRAHC